ncbi:MAG: carboxypeptidase regulatory-like domain-containing protein [Rhodothermales bacterium]
MFHIPTRGVAVCALLIIGALLIDPVQAQTSRFDITGVVADSAGTGLAGATVVALTRADSLLTKFATTNRNGAFTLRRLPAGEYILQVTFVGYQTYREDFSVIDTDVDAGTVTLKVAVAALGELVVSAEHIPFVVKRDTLDYNANAFATRPNAVVEDLLRRLPGIEVEDDGSITAQGEEVKNVLVEGKEFFGSDPTIATKNLPAEAVERVQVYDKQSDKAEFTGIPDGEEEKTINLELKDGAKQGYFGRITGGFGGESDDQGRYDGEASINRFSPSTQLALIANVNNVNRPGFAWGDFLTFMGGMQGFSKEGGRGGGGVQIGGDLNDGFSETLALGLNASHDFGAKNWIRSSYFLSRLENLQDRVVQQQQLLGSEVSSFINQTSNQTSDHLTHRFNVNAQATFAEGHDLRFRGNLTASSSSLGSTGFQETQNATRLNQNTAATQYVTEGDNLGGNAQLTWRKRLTESGRSIVLQAQFNFNDSDLSADLSSTTGLYDRGDVVTYEEILQLQSQVGQTLSHTQRLSFTEPLGSGRVLELFGERTAIDEDQTRAFYDIGGGVRSSTSS